MDEPYAMLTVNCCAKQTQEDVQTAATTEPIQLRVMCSSQGKNETKARKTHDSHTNYCVLTEEEKTDR